MSPSNRQAIELAADLAGSLLLLLVFAGLVALCVLLWFAARGLKLARGRSEEIAQWLAARADQGEMRVEQSVDALVQPQIRALSAWVGVRAGLHHLLRAPVSAARDEAGLVSIAEPPSVEDAEAG